jgi:hypothetical protein
MINYIYHNGIVFLDEIPEINHCDYDKDKTIMVSNKDFMFYHKNGDLTYKNSEIKKNRTIWTILIH